MSEVVQDTTITTEQVEAGAADVIFKDDKAADSQQAESAKVETEAKGVESPEKVNESAATEDKPAEEQPAAEVELKLELKDGVSEEDVSEVLEFAKENKLSQEAAQKILDSRSALQSKFANAQAQALSNAIESWKTEVKNDPEIGGDNFQKSIELANLTISHYDKEFKTVLDKTGLGNHPKVLRLLARIGKDLQDDSLVKNKNHGAPESRSEADLFYT